MRVVFVVSQVTIKASLITRGERHSVLRLNDPVEAVHPTRELEGEFHNCGYEILRSMYIFPQQLYDNFAMSHICDTIKYRWCACHFLIALFSFENISRVKRVHSENRCRFAGKNDTARALPRPFSPQQKRYKKRTHTHESVQIIVILFFPSCQTTLFPFVSSSVRNFKTFHLKVESASYSSLLFSSFLSRKPGNCPVWRTTGN